MKLFKLLYIGLFLLLSTQLLAQLTITSEIRPFVEYRSGYSSLLTQNQESAFFISQRSRIGFRFKKENIQTKLTLQDARIWGGADNFALFEAWAKYDFTKHTSLKFGRQTLLYDEGRLMTARNRRQDAFYYDALVFKYAKDSLYFDLGTSINNSAANLTGNQYAFAETRFKSFHFLHLKKYFKNSFTFSFTGIASGYQKPNSDTTYFKQTIGTKLYYTNSDFSATVEAYYQTGKDKDGRNVDASLVAATLAYRFSNSIKLKVGTEFLSGHDPTNTNADYQSTLHNFDILEGARFPYYGNANYFTNMEKDTKSGGLIDYYTTLELIANKRLSTNITYHLFHLNNTVLNPNLSVLDKNLGSEIDLIARFRIKRGVIAIVGYALILPTSSLETVQNIARGTSKTGHYLWFMLNMPLYMEIKVK